MNVSLRFALLSSAALLASCAGGSSVPPPAAAPAVSASSKTAAIVPQAVTTATTAFTVAALPDGFTIVSGHEGYPTLNNAGAVAGWIGANGTVYKNGQTTTLPLRILTAINDGGDVIGQDANGASFLYRNGTLAPLNGNALSINNNDTIVGMISQADYNAGNQPAYLYPNASPKPMESTPPTDTVPSIVNGQGRAAGQQEFGPLGSDYSPFVFPSLALCENGNSRSGAVVGLNANNDVLLREDGSNSSTFYLCQGSKATLVSGIAQALNDTDVIVGEGERTGSTVTVAYVRTTEGKYWDLNSLVPSGTPHLDDAVAVNNHDQILVASGSRYYLLTPTSRWYGL